jgi:hypothetical protein
MEDTARDTEDAGSLSEPTQSSHRQKKQKGKRKTEKSDGRDELVEEFSALTVKARGHSIRITQPILTWMHRVHETVVKVFWGSETNDRCVEPTMSCNLYNPICTVCTGIVIVHRQEFPLPPMPADLREIFRTLAESSYHFTLHTRGERKNRCLMLYRNAQTRPPFTLSFEETSSKSDAQYGYKSLTSSSTARMKNLMEQALRQHGIDPVKVQQKFEQSNPHQRLLEAPPLDESNTGFRMLQQMGWENNSAEIQAPLSVTKNPGRKGLGSD